MNFKRLALTDFKVDGLARTPKAAALAAALKESDVFAKFAKSAWGQKLAKRAAKVREEGRQRDEGVVAGGGGDREARRAASRGGGRRGRGGDPRSARASVPPAAWPPFNPLALFSPPPLSPISLLPSGQDDRL
jgi:hypothetical protein